MKIKAQANHSQLNKYIFAHHKMKKAFLQLHLAIFLAGFTAIFGKLILLNEGLLVWYRIFLTVLILGGIMFFQKQLQRLSFKEMLKIAGVGLVVAIHWVAFYGSVKYATVSVGLVCLSATGFFTAIIEPLILKKKIVPFELFLGLLAMLGIYIIFDFHPQYKLGILFGMVSAVGSATFPILNKVLLDKYTPRILTLYELGGGLLFLSLLLPIYLQFFKADYYLPSFSDFGWLFILASVCTVFCFDLQLNALKKISAFTANLSYNLEPLYGIILSFMIFHEQSLLNKWFYIGLSIIMLAVTLQMLREWRKRKNNKNNTVPQSIHITA